MPEDELYSVGSSFEAWKRQIGAQPDHELWEGPGMRSTPSDLGMPDMCPTQLAGDTEPISPVVYAPPILPTDHCESASVQHQI